jgi:hypothetical protein
MEYDPNDMEGGLCTLGLLEQLRAECKELWGASSKSYFRVDELLRELGNPNLHEIFRVSAFRVELWDRHAQHVRWLLAATASITIANAVLDTAISEYPSQRLTLRKGAMVIRDYVP